MKTDTRAIPASPPRWQLSSAMLEGALPSLGTLFILIILISAPPSLASPAQGKKTLMADTHLSISQRLPANYEMKSFGEAIRSRSGCLGEC